MGLVEFFYIGLPAIVGSMAFLFLALAYSRFNQKPLPHKISFLLAIPQGILACLAAAFTFSNSISAPACLLGAFGFYVSVVVAVVDLLSLVIFMLLGSKNAGNPPLMHQVAFLVLRLFTHVGFTLGFLWSALLCTV